MSAHTVTPEHVILPLIHHQQLWQEAFDIAADVRPDIPDIIVNFHHDFHFEVTQLHISEISPEMHAAAVSSLMH